MSRHCSISRAKNRTPIDSLSNVPPWNMQASTALKAYPSAWRSQVYPEVLEGLGLTNLYRWTKFMMIKTVFHVHFSLKFLTMFNCRINNQIILNHRWTQINIDEVVCNISVYLRSSVVNCFYALAISVAPQKNQSPLVLHAQHNWCLCTFHALVAA